MKIVTQFGLVANCWIASAILLNSGSIALSQEASQEQASQEQASQEQAITARPIPVTRPEMKQLLEDMKKRTPRIPLPELSVAQEQQLGDRANDYETRLRFHYLIDSEGSAFGSRPVSGASPSADATRAATRDFRRNADENMSLTYEFKTKLFWIVSRTNNCQYCLGHQEQKLAAVGVDEETLGSLDTDWEVFSPAEQAAFEWARKLTWTPQAITSSDVVALRAYYTDLQILEMTMSIAGNNAINRWKEGTGVPQSQHGTRFFENAITKAAPETLPIDSFLTPTPTKFQKQPSIVATLLSNQSRIDLQTSLNGERRSAESPEEVRAQWKLVAERRSQLPLCDAATTHAALGEVPIKGTPAWLRLMANFPNETKRRLASLIPQPVGEEDLSLLDRARVSWVVARQDHAWYATAHAFQQLRDLGQTEDQIWALDGSLDEFTAAEKATLVAAKNLASSPIALSDSEVADVVRLSGPRRATQLINFVTSRAYFDRVTEAAGLSTSEDL